MREIKNVKIVGEAKNKLIFKQCWMCKDMYCMTCEEHLFKQIGYKLPGYSLDDWLCPTCGEEIIRIKNL